MTQHDPDPQHGFAESQEALTHSLLEAMLQEHVQPKPSKPIDGLVIGWITGLGTDGSIQISAPNLGGEPFSARSLCPIGPEQIGAQCAFLFEQGNVERPVIMGLLQHSVIPLTTVGETSISQDAQSVRINAAREIALHCGKASLRLTQDGRIELRGTTLVSHSSGVNRIRGGSIKLN